MMSFFGQKKVELPAHNCVLPHALKIPALEKLVGKRVVLASNSPRRKEILRTFVGFQSLSSWQPLARFAEYKIELTPVPCGSVGARA